MIDWNDVRRVLVVRLRSIGDTVLTTPSLIALRRALPKAQIDVLLEDWVAPVLEGFDEVDEIITLKNDSLRAKLKVAWKIRSRSYDVAFNLHGGTTATFFVAASGAKHRIAYKEVQYSFLYNHLLSSAADFWKKPINHSVEQQLALLGFVGIKVDDRPRTKLKATKPAHDSLRLKLSKTDWFNPEDKIALLHPTTAFETKRWSEKKFAAVADFLSENGFQPVAVGSESEKEKSILEELKASTKHPILVSQEFTLPEIVALASKAQIFVGNDSGIAHIAAAVQTPCVVIFGSSNVNHWHPWTDAPNRVVQKKMPCQPCHGYFCAEFSEPKCITELSLESVIEAIKEVLQESKQSVPEKLRA